MELESWITGLISFAPVLFFESITIVEESPVISSVFLFTVTPSSKSISFVLPACSVTIGLVWGSHVAMVCPGSTLSPSLTLKEEP